MASTADNPTPPALVLDPRTYDRALSCVHCGLCLPACPTYTTTLHEADSPRGRIQLMRALADNAIQPTESVVRHLDLCLDCRGCETACPSGVIYHELIEETRHRWAATRPMSTQDRLLRWVFLNVFTKPTRLKAALLPARILQKIGIYGLLRRSGAMRLLPASFRKMEQMLSPDGPLWPRPLRSVRQIRDQKPEIRGFRVGFFTGCIGSVMFGEVNRKAAELLAAAGAQVVIPPAQECCGAIHHHNGAVEPSLDIARRNIDAFLPEGRPPADAIVTAIAGCGAMLHEYDHLLRDDVKYAARAKEFSRRVKDISVVLLELGLPKMQHRIDAVATYHDACHLAHAQKVVDAPRKLLAAIPGLRLVPLMDSDMCCGAAGTYNLTQPEMSLQLADRKLDNIAATGARICVTGNVGCAMQIQSHAAARGQNLRVAHPVELIYEAVCGGEVSSR